jgi:hypothetical protein
MRQGRSRCYVMHGGYPTIQGVISPTPITGPVAPTPTFVGLTPGQVGLYQINLQLPSTLPAIQPCTTVSACTGNPASCPLPILSNLTLILAASVPSTLRQFACNRRSKAWMVYAEMWVKRVSTQRAENHDSLPLFRAQQAKPAAFWSRLRAGGR